MPIKILPSHFVKPPKRIKATERVFPLWSMPKEKPMERFLNHPMIRIPAEVWIPAKMFNKLPKIKASSEVLPNVPKIETPAEPFLNQPMLKIPEEMFYKLPKIKASTQILPHVPKIETPVESFLNQPMIKIPAEIFLKAPKAKPTSQVLPNVPKIERPAEPFLNQPMIKIAPRASNSSSETNITKQILPNVPKIETPTVPFLGQPMIKIAPRSPMANSSSKTNITKQILPNVPKIQTPTTPFLRQPMIKIPADVSPTTPKPNTPKPSTTTHTRTLEIERKFAPTPLSISLLRTNSNPGTIFFPSHTYLGTRYITDTYFDTPNSLLMNQGIYLRKRVQSSLEGQQKSAEWECKVRTGGDFVNSKFMEHTGLKDVTSVIAGVLKIEDEGGVPLSDVLDVLDKKGSADGVWWWSSGSTKRYSHIGTVASLTTKREEWSINNFRVVIDEVIDPSLGWSVGEVELCRSVEVSSDQDGVTDSIMEGVGEQLDREIEEFMAKYKEVFPRDREGEKVEGKLTKYFRWEKEMGMQKKKGKAGKKD